LSSSFALAAPVNLYELRVTRRLGGVGGGPDATTGGDATAAVVGATAVLVVEVTGAAAVLVEVTGAAAVFVDAAAVFIVVPSL